MYLFFFFFFKQKTAYEMRISDWSSDVCSSDLWQGLVRVANITGNGEVEEFALPSDYDRMLVGGAVQDLDSWAWGYHAYGDINAFLYAQERGFTGSPGGWIIYADKIRFSPPPASGAAATFPYISKRWARDAGPDGYKAALERKSTRRNSSH